MRIARLQVIWILLALGVLALAAILLRPSKRAPAQAAQSAPAAATVVVQRAPIANSFSVAGEFIPWQEVDLHAKVAGYIQRINVDIGDHVREGETLAVLEVPELNAQVEGAAAGVRHSTEEIQREKNEVARAEAAHAALHAAYDRLRQASQARPGLIAEQELDDAQAKDRTSDAQVEVAKSALSAATQQLAVSRATHRQVTTMQDYSRITAPFAGIITWRYADTGALIQAGTSNASSMPVVKVADVDVLRLRIPVPESVAAGVRLGDVAEVRVQATGEKFSGKVARFTGSLDRSTRTMQVEIDVTNKGYKLSPGMYADVTLTLQNQPNALSLPVTAVHRSGSNTTVMLVDATDRVEQRTVQIGAEDAERVEITAGLNEGDRVIAGNPEAYSPGQVVRPKPSRMAAAQWSEKSGGER
jgi:RND family efflux transporter MFP subunit